MTAHWYNTILSLSLSTLASQRPFRCVSGRDAKMDAIFQQPSIRGVRLETIRTWISSHWMETQDHDGRLHGEMRTQERCVFRQGSSRSWSGRRLRSQHSSSTMAGRFSCLNLNSKIRIPPEKPWNHGFGILKGRDPREKNRTCNAFWHWSWLAWLDGARTVRFTSL